MKQRRLRAITLQRAIEKSPILLSHYWQNEWLDDIIIISNFGGTNNIFAEYTYNRIKKLKNEAINISDSDLVWQIQLILI